MQPRERLEPQLFTPLGAGSLPCAVLTTAQAQPARQQVSPLEGIPDRIANLFHAERQLLVTAEQQKRPNIQALPNSSVLSKLKTFLPQMQQANAELQQKLQSCDPAEVNIEHIPEDSGTDIIQMDLACGLLELKDGAALAAAQRAIAAGSEVAVEAYDGGSSSSDSDSDSEDSSGGDNDEAVVSVEPLEGDRNSHNDALNSAEDGDSIQQQQQQQGGQHAAQQHQQSQQGLAGRRRKVKAKRPMVVELPCT